MNKGFVFIILAILALAGCQTKELDVRTWEPKHFTATIEDNFNGLETKTYLDENGNVRWKQGDQVSIFAGSTVNEQHQVTDASDGKTAAEFNKVGGSGFVGGTDFDNNVAFYPYASTAEIAKNGSAYVISDIALPATQNYAEASFGNGAFPMAAVTSNTDDMHLKFKNVLGGLKLQLKGTACIASISVTGNQNEVLCGAATVTVSTTITPSISLTDASAKTVTLDCGEGVQLDTETATPFVIALPPMTMAGGFTVVVTDTNGGTMEIKTTKTQTINRSSLLKMPVVNYMGTPSDYATEPFTITSTGSTSVAIIKVGLPDDIMLEYKKGAGDWTSYTIALRIDLADGESLQFRAGEGGNNKFSKDAGYYFKIAVSGSGTIAASGNIMSLFDRSLSTNTMPENGFVNLFGDCTNLVDAANLKLPATTLDDGCYSGMFAGCTSLATAPELPAATLANYCYAEMFFNTALTAAPNLPATVLAPNCYREMFGWCADLVSPPVLSVTTLADYCYYGMFEKCTSLSTAPSLPATTLADHCYYRMFEDCTNLTSAPTLPATSLPDYCCYGCMFKNCTSLSIAPALPATTLGYGCYEGMFSGCKNLAAAPALSATTLTEHCYGGMFSGCKALTSAPILPATTLVSNCYTNMFSGCSSLNYVKALFTTTPFYSYTDNWLYGVSATGVFVKSKDASWTNNQYGAPDGWNLVCTPEFVDLGLSVKWATFNIGASRPEEYGGYYQWAGTQDVSGVAGTLTWTDAPYGLGLCDDYYEWSKYRANYEVSLESSDDIASICFNGECHIPSVGQWRELANTDNCTWSWITLNGVSGYKVTSKKAGYTSNWIFLPAAGYRDYDSMEKVGMWGRYWSSGTYYSGDWDDTSLYSQAYALFFYEIGSINVGYSLRKDGFSIRPVKN